MTIIKYLIIVILLIVSKNSFATEGDNKFISGKIKTEFFFVDNYTSNNKKNIYKDYYNMTKLSLRANITDQLSLNSVIKSSKMKQNLENEMRDKFNEARSKNQGILVTPEVEQYQKGKKYFTKKKEDKEK